MDSFYTWKDIERWLYMNLDKWQENVVRMEVYSTELVVCLSRLDGKESCQKLFGELFPLHYDEKKEQIFLNYDGQYLNIVYEYEENEKADRRIVPLFKEILYANTAYQNKMLTEKLPDCPVIAFHSYKGGVGRTLSLLAFAKAWASGNAGTGKEKLLIIDSDIEAPGLTWLCGDCTGCFSYLDLLELIQNHDNIEKIVSEVSKKLGDKTIRIETELNVVEHIFMPTYRYIQQLLDLYSSPESIVNGYKKEFIIAEVLSKLGQKLGVSAVFVDLRAGLSEFSAPLLFDPRVKKYLVTSTSYQSIKGTEIILEQLNKGLPMNEDALIPEILLTMIPDSMKEEEKADIISALVKYYDRAEKNGGEETEAVSENSLTDNLLTELPFASELIHLASLEQIFKILDGRDFYKNLYNLVVHNYLTDKKTAEVVIQTQNRELCLTNIHELAGQQIDAEGNFNFRMMMTSAISNLIKKFNHDVPKLVIMGAKGSGKTFLYRELIRDLTWANFLKLAGVEGQDVEKAFMVPLIAPKSAAKIQDTIKTCIKEWNSHTDFDISSSVCVDNGEKLQNFNEKPHTNSEWKEFWEMLIVHSFSSELQSLEELNSKLERQDKKIIFLMDGIEEILKNTVRSESEQKAIASLCQDLMNVLIVKYPNIGCIIFLRKDLAKDSITVNYEQFCHIYAVYELKWSSIEALRLAVWLVSQAVPGFYQEKISVENASREVLDRELEKLWGLKLGKSNSNEAYSSRWILAALSDFNGQLQARDMIRFLQYATASFGKAAYTDRYIMPSEIKRAVPDCSAKKIEEIKQEIGALKPILEKLGNASSDLKLLPFRGDTFALSASDEKIMRQEGYLKVDNEKYYIPEIIRHALGFKYKKGARPKVLSLQFSK